MEKGSGNRFHEVIRAVDHETEHLSDIFITYTSEAVRAPVWGQHPHDFAFAQPDFKYAFQARSLQDEARGAWVPASL